MEKIAHNESNYVGIRRGMPECREKTIFVGVPPRFHKRVKVILTERGLTINEYVHALIAEDLGIDMTEGTPVPRRNKRAAA